MTINLAEFHYGKEKNTFGISILTINGYSLFEVWKGCHAFWLELLFVKLVEKERYR